MHFNALVIKMKQHERTGLIDQFCDKFEAFEACLAAIYCAVFQQLLNADHNQICV